VHDHVREEGPLRKLRQRPEPYGGQRQTSKKQQGAAHQ
jgi:hypothetical protein